MSLQSVQTSLIAVLGSRAWKFTPSRVLTKSVEALLFNLHIPSFTKFYQNHQGNFCCYKLDCAYCLQLSSVTGHSNSDLFPHNKSSFCPALRKTQIPCRVCDTLNDGTKCTFSKFTGSRNLEGVVDTPGSFVVFQSSLSKRPQQAGEMANRNLVKFNRGKWQDLHLGKNKPTLPDLSVWS